MEYDQEFENCIDRIVFKKSDSIKDTMYQVWKAAKAPKPEKKIIELQGGYFEILGDSTIITYYSSGMYRKFGRERKTEADAKKAAELMRKRDRLAAYVYEHCGYEGESTSKCDHYIYIDAYGEYCYEQEEIGIYDLCKQYMPKTTAIWLCEKLNSGEIVL